MKQHRIQWLVIGLGLISLAGCQTPENENELNYAIQAEPKPSEEPPSRYGNQSSYTVNGKTYYVKPTSENYVERGISSWYGKKFHGRPTSSMEPFDMFAISAAHPTLPIPTYVQVTNLENSQSIIVRVNDRGPFHANRIIDLSYGAAVKLGFANQGTAQVEVKALAPYQVRWQGINTSTTSIGQPGFQHGTAYEAAYESGNPHQRYVYLQTGAYLDSNQARKAIQRMESWLNKVGIQVPVHLVFGNGFQKIHLGPMNQFGQAERLQERLTSSEWGKPIWIEVNPNR